LDIDSATSSGQGRIDSPPPIRLFFGSRDRVPSWAP
jgi:hypothetical protein